MLREDPAREQKKKKKDYAHPSRMRLFWRIQWECFRRAVTPMLMYMFMSMIMLTCQLVGDLWLKIFLGVLCIAGGAFFNGHLCYSYGKIHYGSYIAGELHRRNELYGIPSGGDHRPDREYRWWKGPIIGVYVALPVLILGIVAGIFPPTETGLGAYALYAYAMFAGYGILPLTWFGAKPEGQGFGLVVSPFWSLLFALIPIVVSTVFYIVGAWREQVHRVREAERMEEVASVGKNKKK